MIERPKRSVTRFFVPLIDVLILLFCIFLLMPFVSSNEAAKEDPEKKSAESPKNLEEMRAELERSQREVAKLRAERANTAERLSVKILEIDPQTGELTYLHDGARIKVGSQAEADAVITQHRRASGTKDTLFLILYPRQRSGYPEQIQADNYARWFKDVQFQFDQPFR